MYEKIHLGHVSDNMSVKTASHHRERESNLKLNGNDSEQPCIYLGLHVFVILDLILQAKLITQDD